MNDRRFKVRTSETPEKMVLHFDRQELRPAVERFAEAMEKTLRENDHKNGWEHMTNAEIFQRITQERDELLIALCDPADFARGCKVRHEAVDLANFCMMLFDNNQRRDQQEVSR